MTVVLLPTIPSRLESCERVLDMLARQTMKPHAVFVIMDSWHKPWANTKPEAEPKEWSWVRPQAYDSGNVLRRDFNVIHVIADPNLAQCTRWKLLDALFNDWDRVIFTLDDDMVFDETYLERTYHQLMEWTRTDKPFILSHGGVDTSYRFHHYYDDDAPACDLVLPQAGAMAFRAHLLAYIRDCALGDRALVRGGSEEVPIAVHAHLAKVRIRRPAGSIIKPSPEAYRGSYVRGADFLVELLRWCVKEVPAWPHAESLLKLYRGVRSG